MPNTNIQSEDEVERMDFVPCPLCKQYSHSIRGDKLSEAFNHFQMMFSHRGDGIPTQHCFDEKTRDAAQVLMAALTAPPVGDEEPQQVSPADDPEVRAFIAGWNAKLEGELDFDRSLHFWLRGQAGLHGAMDLPAPTPAEASHADGE